MSKRINSSSSKAVIEISNPSIKLLLFNILFAFHKIVLSNMVGNS